MPELRRDGVRLFYQEAGRGGPSLMFVHGLGGDGRHFEPQMEHFQRHHRVVALDRRGHGASDKPEGSYAVADVAEEIGWMVRELGLHRPVLVVHSMGALGLELAAREPELLAGLVLLDTPFGPPPPEFQSFLAGLRMPAYAQFVDALCDRVLFLPTDDQARRTRLQRAMMETPRHVLFATWRGYLEWRPRPVTLPLLHIAAVMPRDLAALYEIAPQVHIGRTVGAGHYHQLEVPWQVNSMIERFLEVGLSAP